MFRTILGPGQQSCRMAETPVEMFLIQVASFPWFDDPTLPDRQFNSRFGFRSWRRHLLADCLDQKSQSIRNRFRQPT